ncbi:hypothetical protein [Peptoclostridium sp. AF21-18]|uniref:hypothetical protein n=1 Tax=Peptoclostridium sp. AF21-18 TaxID=2292243 RepID=UPI000E53B8B2|nr:hypothetical protein [Peptoclostridium sp. AF21-18]RHQ99210.1 hypothetical protein DWX74_01605 [Peptoclostridium sp. AF21-18]
MRKEEKLVKGGKIEIKEKIEIKDVEMQADPCKGNNHKPCKYDCCQDCHNHTTSYGTDMY